MGNEGGMKEMAENSKNDAGKRRFLKRKVNTEEKLKISLRDIARAGLILAHFMVAFLGSSLLTQIVFFAIFGQGWSGDAIKSLASQIAADILTIMIVVYGGKKLFKTKTSRESLGLAGLVRWRDIGWALVGFAAYLVVAAVITNVLAEIAPWFNANESQNLGFSGLYGAGERLIGFAALAVAIPVLEEILFRGWMYEALREKFGFISTAFLVSLVFGVLHGQLNVGISVFVMSFVMCLIRERTKTIYGPIVLHMIKNAIAFYLVYVTMMV
jgi:membrane protease YdiL (CAAX protease family)